MNQTINFTDIAKVEQKGQKGVSFCQTLQFDGLRIRLIELSAGYISDHWYRKGHIIHCLAGEVINEQYEGAKSIIKQGMSYLVSDDSIAHRTLSKYGARLMIVDGDFLKMKKD